MSEVFFEDLRLPRPDVHLGIHGGSHAEQTGRMLMQLEPVLTDLNPDCVVVVGDVNSTLAASLCAAKLNIPVAHVEAGLRSFNRRMPEEVNRTVTDHLATWLFTTEPSAATNLLNEGIHAERIFFVGNVMVDSLREGRPRARQSTILDDLGLSPRGYGVLTLHRPENVDNRERVIALAAGIGRVAARIPIVWPVHPRVHWPEAEGGRDQPGLRRVPPLRYLDFLRLMDSAAFVLTDSGGVQEETTALGVPCLTLRDETERPVTVTVGTNTVIGVDPARIVDHVDGILAGGGKVGTVPELWDGNAAVRIADVLCKVLDG